MSQCIVISDIRTKSLAINAITNLPIEPRHQVTIALHKRKRRNQQNRLMWAALNDISKQAWIDYRRFSAEVLHEHCKREFLPETCAKGVEKWGYLPSGERILIMSTTDLNTAEFADYMHQVFAFGGELGVVFESSL